MCEWMYMCVCGVCVYVYNYVCRVCVCLFVCVCVCWGERERAPHWRVVREPCLYIYICMLLSLFRTSYRKSPPALILRVLASFVNSKTIHKLLRKGTNHRTCTSLMATARTETTRGPTYSMTRVIWATPWQKGFICRCHCFHCHYSPLTVEVTRHMDQPLQWPHRWACQRECNLSVDTSCKAHGVLDSCACSNCTDRAWKRP